MRKPAVCHLIDIFSTPVPACDILKMSLSVVLLTAGYSLPTVLHVVGIILLYKAKGGLPNERIITLNLAIAEMLFCVLNVIFCIIVLSDPLLTSTQIMILFCISATFFFSTRFAVLHVIIDRFLDIWLNIKYPLYMINKKLRFAIVTQWILGFIFATIIIFLVSFNFISINTVAAIRVCLDIIILIAAVVTFTYLFLKVKNLENITQGKEHNRISSILVNFKIPMLMVATFVVFNISGSICYFVRTNEYRSAVFEVLSICGWCSDALIYIFLQKRVRRLLPLKCCRRAKENNIADVQLNQLPWLILKICIIQGIWHILFKTVICQSIFSHKRDWGACLHLNVA